MVLVFKLFYTVCLRSLLVLEAVLQTLFSIEDISLYHKYVLSIEKLGMTIR